MARGMFILFEGGDGCGKSTQAQLLFQVLQKTKMQVKFYKFPDFNYTFSGCTLHHYLTEGGRPQYDPNHIQFVFQYQRRQRLKEMIADLRSGITIIVDRYSFSGIVYSYVQNGKVDLKGETGLLYPDLVFLVDCDTEVAMNRGYGVKDRYETLEFQSKVRPLFKSIADKNLWTVLDSNKNTAVDLHTQVMDKVLQVLPVVQNNPLGFLDFSKFKITD